MKLFASDFDGTFFFKDNPQIFDKNVKTVQKFQKENKFMFVTGRDPRSIRLSLKGSSLKPDYFACYNGARIFDSDMNEIYVQEMKIDFEKLKNALKNTKAFNLYIFSSDSVYSHRFRFKWHRFVSEKKFLKRLGTSRERDLKRIKDKMIYMSTVSFETEEDAHEGARIIEALNLGCKLHINKRAIDITTKNVGKDKAVEFMKNYVQADQVGVIGDSFNDLEMIRKFNGFTVSSANEQIQKEATYVVESVSEAIEKM